MSLKYNGKNVKSIITNGMKIDLDNICHSTENMRVFNSPVYVEQSDCKFISRKQLDELEHMIGLHNHDNIDTLDEIVNYMTYEHAGTSNDINYSHNDPKFIKCYKCGSYMFRDYETDNFGKYICRKCGRIEYL